MGEKELGGFRTLAAGKEFGLKVRGFSGVEECGFRVLGSKPLTALPSMPSLRNSDV